MAAALTYNMKTLNDNWFEDRLQPDESMMGTRDPARRTTRMYETDIAYIGERYDVLNRISRFPQRESYATPDDGFREKERTSRVDFAHPKSRKEHVANPPEKARIISTESVPEVGFEERRPLPGNQRGFGAVLQRHEDNHDQRHWKTTTGDFFGQSSEGINRRSQSRLNPSELGVSGVSTKHEEERAEGVKVGKMCGECWNETDDPSSDTRTQRAWLYTRDPAIANVHLGGTKPPLSKFDNHMSLPLGEGAMSKVRADLEARKGRLYRVATNITKGNGHRSGVSIFQDARGENDAVGYAPRFADYSASGYSSNRVIPAAAEA